MGSVAPSMDLRNKEALAKSVLDTGTVHRYSRHHEWYRYPIIAGQFSIEDDIRMSHKKIITEKKQCFSRLRQLDSG